MRIRKTVSTFGKFKECSTKASGTFEFFFMGSLMTLPAGILIIQVDRFRRYYFRLFQQPGKFEVIVEVALLADEVEPCLVHLTRLHPGLDGLP